MYYYYRRKKSFSVLTLCLCILLSSAFGFAGGFAANKLSADNALTLTNNAYTYDDPAADNSILRLASNATGGAMTVAEAAASVKQAVVEITTESVVRNAWIGQYVQDGAGSGVIVSTDGYIVTNYHVISEARSATVRLSNGKTYSASLKGADAKTDLAILKIDATGLTPAVYGDSTQLVVGQTSIAVGNPLGELGGTVTCGIISALGREIIIDGESMTLLQTDASVSPGNSGGGLFNLAGELIGVVNAKSSGSGTEGIGFAIPINTVKSVISDIMAVGYVRGRVDTGFTLVNISTTQLAMRYRVSQTGLYISKSANSAFVNGDRITAINNTPVTNLASYNTAMKGFAVGDTIQVTVARGAESLTIPLTLSELKS